MYFVEWFTNFMHTFWADFLKFFFGISLLLLISGCGQWTAEVTEGTHTTEWNHGLVIEWGTKVYIGPEDNSRTTIEHKFEGDAVGNEPTSVE